MKKLLIFAALLGCVIFGCKKKETVSQAGVYRLDKQMASSGGKDTIYRRTQMKVYTDRYFMYSGTAPDSSVGFGVGSYNLDTGNRIIERNIYSSGYLDSSKSFNLLITRKDSGYSQIIPDLLVVKGVKWKLIEDYSKLPASDTSLLDGLWKLDKTFWVKGKDTTKGNETQFKIFWGGHFMFVHRYPLDQAQKTFKNGFGYGTFSFKQDTLTEEEEMSSHSVLVGRRFAIKITLNGNDEYSQVINDSKANLITTEIYRRVK
ncbi:hypothetical protein ACPPVU_05690 [Mucilaginibacter sp. McL0603]|uniref:hypothetical protein n=1 Tax=Mucilaginibacter sp. McL0603 TaxID=3415670 RepID=UPI003CE80237